MRMMLGLRKAGGRDCSASSAFAGRIKTIASPINTDQPIVFVYRCIMPIDKFERGLFTHFRSRDDDFLRRAVTLAHSTSSKPFATLRCVIVCRRRRRIVRAVLII